MVAGIQGRDLDPVRSVVAEEIALSVVGRIEAVGVEDPSSGGVSGDALRLAQRWDAVMVSDERRGQDTGIVGGADRGASLTSRRGGLIGSRRGGAFVARPAEVLAAARGDVTFLPGLPADVGDVE